jgi:aminoglycoside 6-adenylyltransferase
MRSESEMFDLILQTAHDDERIRAVMMNGSRANPNAPRDFFQDFDIVYFVNGIDSFKAAPNWITHFGKMMILQLPDDMADPPPDNPISYAYLMQFADGNRIDLTLYPIDKLGEREEDSQTVILLDKDGLFAPFPPADDGDYLPKPPTAKAFADCCNEFWWVSPYVAKGLWRDELTNARHMMDDAVREQLMKMLTWYVGVKTRFSRSPGKYGKYIKQFLEPELWAMLEQTYPDANYEHTWDALLVMGELFRRTAAVVADHFGYEYSRGDDERVTAHLRYVRCLPRDAAEMY